MYNKGYNKGIRLQKLSEKQIELRNSLINTKIRVSTDTRQEIVKMLTDMVLCNKDGLIDGYVMGDNEIHSYYIDEVYTGFISSGSFSENYFNNSSDFFPITIQQLRDIYSKFISIETEHEVKQQQTEKKYMICVQGKKAPRVIHNSLEEAEAEAKRLAGIEIDKQVMILEYVKSYKAKVVIEEI